MTNLKIYLGGQYPNVPAYSTTTIAVDGTNTNDMTATICNAISAAGSGSSSLWRRFLLVPSGGTTVKITTAVQISALSYFVLDLNGCALKTDSGAAFTQLTAGIVLGHAYGGFWGGDAHHFVITNGTCWQHNPNPGVYDASREQQANIEIAGGATSTPCHDGVIYNMTLRGAGGDCLKLGGTGDIVYNIDGYGNSCLDAGRMGYTVIYGHDLTWGKYGANAYGPCGYCCIDVEPNDNYGPCSNIEVSNNTYTTWAQEFAALNGSSTTSAFDHIKISGNTITGSSLRTIFNNGASRPTNIEFTSNVSTAAAVAGPVLLFAHIDHLKYLNPANTQPLSSDGIASVTDCTDVT